jgi:8-oxo-dGTP diphosphatase
MNRFHRPTGETSMPSRFCYEYPRPAVTVDLVVFATIDDQLRVLLIRRKHAPFEGRWAIPGGFLEIEEPLEDGARRELKEETGLELPGPIEQIGVFGKPGRDPRGRTISIAYAGLADPAHSQIQGGDDAASAEWFNPLDPPQLAFDHAEILALGIAWYRKKRRRKSVPKK